MLGHHGGEGMRGVDQHVDPGQRAREPVDAAEPAGAHVTGGQAGVAGAPGERRRHRVPAVDERVGEGPGLGGAAQHQDAAPPRASAHVRRSRSAE